MLTARDIKFAYTAGTAALDGVSFSIEHGERVGLVGANGAGKSTLMSILCGLELPQSGSLEADGITLTKKTVPDFHQLVGMVFQNPDDQLFSPTVFDDVAFGLRARREDDDSVRHRVMHTLEHMGISALAQRPPYRLSGGEKRSAAIACVLAMNPRYIMYDEPTAFLDRRAKRTLMDIIPTITAGQLIASHDFDLVEGVCTRVIILSGGKIRADGAPNKLLHDDALLMSAGLYLGGKITMHEHHGHEHQHGIQSKEETLATLVYMLRHNEHHADELKDLAHNLEHLDMPDAAAKVLESVTDFERGNAKLSAVLASIKGE